MKNPNTNPSNKNNAHKVKIATRVAALGLAAASVTPAGVASASQSHERATTPHFATVNEAIVAQDQKISMNIANQIPVHFKNEIAYYHGPGKDHFYIENPLSATVSVGSNHKIVNLIGYIERKGSGLGPDVVMFEDTKTTTSSYPDNADPAGSIHQVNNVVFPSFDGSAYNLNVPIDPSTEAAYLNQAGETSLIAYQYVAKK